MPLKIVILGAGSYVFTPSILHDLIVEHRLGDMELCLIDPDVEAAELMAGVARRMAAEAEIDVSVSAGSDRRAALAGAAYVTAAVAVEGAKRWRMDRDIAERHGVVDANGELGGLGGMSYALRQIALTLAICRDMEALCPRALLLNLSNPLPRIITAVAAHTPIEAYGFCNVACGGVTPYENLARLLGRPAASFRAVSAGVNHFNWLLRIADAESGEDLYPALRAAVAGGGLAGQPLSVRCLERYGFLPLSGDDHIMDFMAYEPAIMHRTTGAFHGTPEERRERRAALRKMGSGELDWRGLLAHRAWEKPAEVIAAISTGEPVEMPMINLRNNGVMPELPEETAVEVPCRVGGEVARVRPSHAKVFDREPSNLPDEVARDRPSHASRPLPETFTHQGEVARDRPSHARGLNGVEPLPVGPLPESIRGLIAITARVNTLVAHAGASGDVGLLREAIAVDPAIPNKAGALAALPELLGAHADLLPAFK